MVRPRDFAEGVVLAILLRSHHRSLLKGSRARFAEQLR